VTAAWVIFALVALLLLSGLVERVTKAIAALTAAIQFAGYATVRAAVASEQTLKTAKEQIEMNRALVEAVRNRPVGTVVEMPVDGNARKH
jgi:hypothetical protein